MESITNKKIKLFISLSADRGYGDDGGSGYSSGSGYGDGSNDDDRGSGYGDGSGYGCGSGYGDGSGSSSSFGYGGGDGSGIKNINNKQVFSIDGLQTIFTNVKNNMAKGFILKEDLTSEKCFIVKRNNIYAHGTTLKQAYEALNKKLFNHMSLEERIDSFLSHFKIDKKYKAKEFFDWHGKLTGSCEFGRKVFIENNQINLESKYSIAQFINLTRNSYGSNVICELEKKTLK